jgi:hypothetical protein
MKPKKFIIEPYKNALYLFCPCSKSEAIAWCKRKKIHEHMDLDDYDEKDAITFGTSAGSMIFMHKFDDTPAGIGVLVHELCHATFNVLNHAGVKEEEGNEEAAAYLLDNLVEKCLKHLRGQRPKQVRAEAQTSPDGEQP